MKDSNLYEGFCCCVCGSFELMCPTYSTANRWPKYRNFCILCADACEQT